MTARGLTALLLGAFLLGACQSQPTGPGALMTSTATLTPGSCHTGTDSGQPLPDPRCTPGALNPAVTQADIGSTICRSGWATQQRKRYLPYSLSSKFKRQVEDAYGIPHNADAEGDHLIPIELGSLPGPMSGAPSFTLNFWPQRNDHPKPGVLNMKDLVEDAANKAVCSGRMTLAAAQQQMAADWVKLGQALGILH